MSRMLFLKTSLSSNNNAVRNKQPAFVNGAQALVLTLGIISAAIGTNAVAATGTPTMPKGPVTSVSPGVTKDPLAGDTWHADTPAGTWPGTLVFNASKKNVTLSPVGATPMDASYTYTVKPSSNAKLIEGTLRMTNSAKQVSDSTFRIQGKILTLTYGQGQRPETYVRMTPQEEAADKARLEKLISEGRIRPIK